MTRISVVSLLVLALSPGAGRAQLRPSVTALPEARAELVIGDVTTALLSGGLHLNAGTYFRVAAIGAVGTAWRDASPRSGLAGRLELQGRFHLDPFRDSRVGLYGIGGLAAVWDEFSDWRGRLILGAGVELPARARAALALEAALAGGVRVSVVARRLPAGGR